MSNKKILKPNQAEEMMQTLKFRFDKNKSRHLGIEWSKIEKKLELNPTKLWSIAEMDKTGGEPDVVGYDKKTDEYIFYDCSPETPKERRSICYDRKALDSRKENKPKGSAIEMATAMGVQLLTEDEYKELQKLGTFDTKTSSWIQTPSKIRDLGGALFADFRYGTVFIYHNGAESYYAVRGFRSSIRV